VEPTRTCPHCGRGNLNTHTFCAACGKRLTSRPSGSGLKLVFGAVAIVAGLLWGAAILKNQRHEPVQSLPPSTPVASAYGATPSPEDTPAKDSSSQQAYKVKRVVDGGTLVASIDGREVTVRLIGVDTPETSNPQQAVADYGRESLQFVRGLLDGESVFLEYEPDSARLDKSGRTLAYVYRSPDRLFVNQEIIRQGYGHTYAKYSFKHLEAFRSHERAAKEAGKGLWGQGAQIVSDVQPAQPRGESPSRRDQPPATAQTPKTPAKVSDHTHEMTVYVTRTGEKYHRDGCRYLSRSRIPMSLKDAKLSYSACSVCRPPQ
jgi:micrococcal nuclease